MGLENQTVPVLFIKILFLVYYTDSNMSVLLESFFLTKLNSVKQRIILKKLLANHFHVYCRKCHNKLIVNWVVISKEYQLKCTVAGTQLSSKVFGIQLNSSDSSLVTQISRALIENSYSIYKCLNEVACECRLFH